MQTGLRVGRERATSASEHEIAIAKITAHRKADQAKVIDLPNSLERSEIN
jgi:hypothetical protein